MQAQRPVVDSDGNELRVGDEVYARYDGMIYHTTVCQLLPCSNMIRCRPLTLHHCIDLQAANVQKIHRESMLGKHAENSYDDSATDSSNPKRICFMWQRSENPQGAPVPPTVKEFGPQASSTEARW